MGPERLGWAGLTSRRARGWSPVSPRPLVCPSPRPGWASSLSYSSCVLVVTKKVGGGGLAQMGPYLLGVEAAGGTEVLVHKACSVSPTAGLPFCPARSLSSTISEIPHMGPPTTAPQPGASPGWGCPRWDRQGPPGQQSKRELGRGLGSGFKARGGWGAAAGPEPCLGRH